jgi:hypothetical protein
MVGLVDEQDRQVGLRVDAQLLQRERGQPNQPDLVDLDAGLVVDVDHDDSPDSVLRRCPA